MDGKGRERREGEANKGFLGFPASRRGEGKNRGKGREVRKGERERKGRGHVHCIVLMPCKGDNKIYAMMHDSFAWILHTYTYIHI